MGKPEKRSSKRGRDCNGHHPELRHCRNNLLLPYCSPFLLPFVPEMCIRDRYWVELDPTRGGEMAKAAGINMMPCFLKEIDGSNHFVTERFDRKNGEKLFSQTLAAIDVYKRQHICFDGFRNNTMYCYNQGTEPIYLQ